MKVLFAIFAAIGAATSALFAQTLNVTEPGYSGVKLFDATPGFTISAMGADAAGTVYYMETDGAFTANTTLYKRTVADSYAAAVPLFSFGSFVFGSFVVAEAGKVYFGEGSTNVIRSINPDGTGVALIGTVVGSVDLAFSGGNAFVSANPDTTFTNPQNRIVRLDLGTGATDQILDATPDFSGPIEFDAAGGLLYGAAKASIGGIYRYSAAEVAGAFGPTSLTLAPPANRVVNNGANLYLAFGGGSTLWQDDFSTLRIYDLVASTSTTIASTPHTLGHLDSQGGILYANVTNFGTNRSAVFSVVPEPSSALLLAFGVLAFARRRR